MTGKIFKAMLVEEVAEKKFARRIIERSVDELPQGEVLVKVSYSSLNYKDALSVTGIRGVTRNYPHTPGVDAAGMVEVSSSDTVLPGDKVIVTGYDLGMNTSGGFGQYIRVPEAWVVKLPEGISLRESMIYGTAGFSAALSIYKLQEHGVVSEQGEILVTGATGGVGSFAVAILARAGYQVVAVSGKKEQKQFLIDSGASEVINREQATDLSGKSLLKERWAGVVDTVGGHILETAIKSTRLFGAVTCCGNVASAQLETTIYPYILRGVSLLGVSSQNCPMAIRKYIWQMISTDWKLDQLDRLAREVSLEDLDPEIDHILQGKIKGRVIVNMGE